MQSMQLVELTSKMHRACQQFTKTIINSAELGTRPADIQQLRLTLCANIAQQLLQISPVTDLHRSLTGSFRHLAANAGFRYCCSFSNITFVCLTARINRMSEATHTSSACTECLFSGVSMFVD